MLVQPMLTSDTSFVIHSTSPYEPSSQLAVVELAPGLGETLASAQRGSPWRLSMDKANGKVR